MLIKNQRDCAKRIQEIKEYEKQISQSTELLINIGLTPDQINGHLSSLNGVVEDLQKEVNEYNDLKNKTKTPCGDITGIGEILIKTRIYLGLTQKELADKMRIDETQISRYERSNYRGINLTRFLEIIEALEVDITCMVVPK